MTFRVTLNGEPIQTVELPRKTPIHIRIDGEEGFVPEYDAREAALFAGYTWREWLAEHWYNRAAAVAHYRLHHLVEAHVQEATERQAKAEARRNQGSSGGGGGGRVRRPARR